MASGCAKKTDRRTSLELLDKRCAEALVGWNREALDSLADSLAVLAQKESSYRYLARSEYYKGTFREDGFDSILEQREMHLSRAKDMAEKISDDTLLCRIYNTMGLWEMSRRSRYATAQYYFNKSASIARKVKHKDYEIVAETNMSEAMRQFGDTLSFAIDSGIFAYACSNGNLSLMAAAGSHCANYLAATASDTTQLYPYIEPVVKTGKYPDMRPSVYARFYYNKRQYATALKWIEQTDTKEYVDLVILRAQILSALGRYEESNEWIEVAMKAFNSGFSAFGIEEIFNLAASNHYAMGHSEEAFCYVKRYSKVSDSLLRLHHTDRLHRYRVEYEVGKKNDQIALQQQKVKFWKLMVVAGILLLASSTSFYVFYSRRRNRFYRRLVDQYRQKLEEESEKAAAFCIQTMAPESMPKVSPISDEKADSVFSKIMEAVNVRHVYRNPNLTRESFAMDVGVNRTYFSEIIKRKTGLSYTQFITEARVKEAARILSDKNDASSLKEISSRLGFASMSTFFTSFKSITGVPPSAFRKAAGS